MAPTRREQLELDELLSDIYRGIESLPDKSSQQQANKQVAYALDNKRPLFARTHAKEYELDASSPLVAQHRRELAQLRNSSGNNQQDQSFYAQESAALLQSQSLSNHLTSQQPHRSTLKRQPTVTPERQFGSFVGAASTPERERRRVRIVEQPARLGGYSSDDYNDNEEDNQPPIQHQQQVATNIDNNNKRGKVKRINTNKLIYHQEKNPDDEELQFYGDEDADEEYDSDGVVRNRRQNSKSADQDYDDDDDIDGVTRVEYYHTTWLDRQLGRASKRRSSKELRDRQVKEKAMIEELKRSLKNGAITLRQSFKGKKNQKQSKVGESLDDQYLDLAENTHNHNSNNKQYDYKQRSVFGSGLATIPRNYQASRQSAKSHLNNNTSTTSSIGASQNSSRRPFEDRSSNAPKTLTDYSSTTAYLNRSTQENGISNSNNYSNSKQEARNMQLDHQQQPTVSNYSRTLPHSYHQPSSRSGQHQLLQSHYRGNLNTQSNLRPTAFGYQTNQAHQTESRHNYSSNVRSSNGQQPPAGYCPPPSNQERQYQPETISSIPSATEVVRSALSRSNSQASIGQLNKTINLLPNSPPPYSPMTPTQNLKASTPSLSPSPSPGHQHYSSKTLGATDRVHLRQQQQQQEPLTRLTGTRYIDKPQQQQPGSQQQPVYANPHAALMQHRMDQQMRQPHPNTASIREFNELDSLLRSLSPHSMTHITPGYSSKPAAASLGGYGPIAAQPSSYQSTPRVDMATTTTSSNTTATTNNNTSINNNNNYNNIINNNATDVYARVHKTPSQSEQTKAAYLQQHYMAPAATGMSDKQPYTIDVTQAKDDSCLLKKQNMSEFEPPIDILPSMEDYQNISRLNPVKNHYWYKPHMSRDRAINLLKDKPQGTFIVRDSTSFKGAFGLAVKVSKLPKNVLNNASLRNPNDPSAELIRHFLIEPTTNGIRLKGYANEPVFNSLPNLIYQHSLTELALPCKLVIPRADIEDPNFNQKQKQFYDEFVASKELAKHMPYEVTSPNGGYRKYPGDVYVHNEHRIIFD